MIYFPHEEKLPCSNLNKKLTQRAPDSKYCTIWYWKDFSFLLYHGIPRAGGLPLLSRLLFQNRSASAFISPQKWQKIPFATTNENLLSFPLPIVTCNIDLSEKHVCSKHWRQDNTKEKLPETIVRWNSWRCWQKSPFSPFSKIPSYPYCFHF